MRFVLDGPPLASVKRFGAHVAAHCTEVGRFTADDDGSIYSAWVLPANGATQQLHVIEHPSGEVVHRVLPRPIGVRVRAAQRLAPDAVLDREIAAGIAMQVRDDDCAQRAFVGWDGVLRVVQTSPPIKKVTAVVRQDSGKLAKRQTIRLKRG